MNCDATRHNTLNAYKNHGCRCLEARTIWARYMKEYHLRRRRGESLLTDATGTRRRLRALQAIGWRWQDIADRLDGVSSNAISQMSRRPFVQLNSARAVSDLYDELWQQPGPSARCRRLAEAEGWPTPLELDDEYIDDPFYQPTLHRLTPTIARRQERQQTIATIAALTAKGMSAKTIAVHVGLSTRSVVRYRDRLRDAS